MSYLDEEIIEDLRKNNVSFMILPEAEHELIVNKINKSLPFSGSQIAWSSLKESTYFGTSASDAALESLAKEIQLACKNCIFIVGDSTDNAYSVNINYILPTLQVFSTIPQHTYIVSETISWIACISFEGDLDFANTCLKADENSLNK